MTQFSNATQSAMLSLLRVVSGYLLLVHGTAKILGVPKLEMFANLPVLSLYGAAGILELILGALILVGLFSRIACFIASGLCAAAYFIGHADSTSFLLPLTNGGESAVLFCFIFLALSVLGPGRFSVDALWHK